MRKTYTLLSFIFISGLLQAQVGGSYTYAFLDVPSTARITAMGGNLITFKDRYAGQGADNPSLLNYKMDKSMTLSYMSYFADIKSTFASYTFHNKIGTFNGAIKYLDYGSFREADAGNNELGSFSASEAAFIVGYGRELDSSFSVGANVKFIYSNLYLVNSTALAVDLSASYQIKKSLFLATLVIKNMGFQIDPYIDGQQEPLPFDIQFGISKRFKNMPFKFSFVAHQLGRGNLTYPSIEDNSSSAFGDNNDANQQSAFENIIRHVIVGAEFLPDKNFNFRIGYNFQRRREMQFADRPATVGLSWGFGLKISKFKFSYARSAYHLAGSPNHFTIVTRFSDWAKG